MIRNIGLSINITISTFLVVWCKLVDDKKRRVEGPPDVVFEPLPDILEQYGGLPARALVCGSTGMVPIRLLNVEGPRKLYKSKTLGTLDAYIGPLATVRLDARNGPIRQKQLPQRLILRPCSDQIAIFPVTIARHLSTSCGPMLMFSLPVLTT